MDINFEMLILCNLTLFFTVAYFVLKEPRAKPILGILSAIAWFVLGIAYVASSPTFPAIALMLWGVGVTLIALVLYDSFQLKKERIWTFQKEEED